jgi:hypothetical protein
VVLQQAFSFENVAAVVALNFRRGRFVTLYINHTERFNHWCLALVRLHLSPILNVIIQIFYHIILKLYHLLKSLYLLRQLRRPYLLLLGQPVQLVIEGPVLAGLQDPLLLLA